MDNKHIMFYKTLVIGIIILFIGVAIQPSVATVQPEDIDLEYFDVTTEFIGLGKKYTTQLTKEEIKELDALFDSISDNLNKSVSQEETVEIFKDAVLKLDSFGLLGDVGIDETEKLVTNYYQNPKLMKTLERLHNRDKKTLNEDENTFCFISGITHDLTFLSIIGFSILVILIELGIIPGLGDPLLSYLFLMIFAIPFFYIPSIFIPFCLGRMIDFGDEAWGGIITFGSNGLKYWNGKLKGMISVLGNTDIGVFGFIGLKIDIVIQPYEFFIGFAPRVHIEYRM